MLHDENNMHLFKNKKDERALAFEGDGISFENNGYFFANKFEKFRFEVMSLSKNKQCRIIFEILRYFQDENSGNCFSMSWVRTKDRKTASSSFPKKRLEGEFDMNADF